VKPARIVVDNRVRVFGPDVGARALAEIRGLFEHKNPKHEQMKHMGFRFDHRKEPRLIATWRDDGGGWLSVPRGGMRRVRELLEGRGHELRVRDLRTSGLDAILNGLEWPAYRRTLYDDQEAALAALLERETCYLRAPCGSGKTTITTALIDRVRRPACVIVWTGSLFDQWIERVRDEMGFRKRDIGVVKGGVKKIGAVTVAMQQTIARFPPTDQFFRFFGLVAADELQRFSAPTFVASVDPFTARYRIGVSANERRKDRKEFLAHDLFADLALSIDRKELVEKGRVRDVEIRVVPTAWKPPIPIEVENAGLEFGTFLDVLSVAEERDALVIELVAEELGRGEQILVFSLRVEHCRRLVARLTAAGISAGLLLGGQENRLARTETIKGLRRKSLQVAVGTTQAVGTGVDLPSVGVGIATMPVAQNRQDFNQVVSRVCRIAGGETPARFYVLADPDRRQDWAAYFADDRPVFVRQPGGEWLDARHHRRAAKLVAFPKEEGLWPESE
jgi:superfamily II DNA or RNA helicase